MKLYCFSVNHINVYSLIQHTRCYLQSSPFYISLNIQCMVRRSVNDGSEESDSTMQNLSRI